MGLVGRLCPWWVMVVVEYAIFIGKCVEFYLHQSVLTLKILIIFIILLNVYEDRCIFSPCGVWDRFWKHFKHVNLHWKSHRDFEAKADVTRIPKWMFPQIHKWTKTFQLFINILSTMTNLHVFVQFTIMNIFYDRLCNSDLTNLNNKRRDAITVFLLPSWCPINIMKMCYVTWSTSFITISVKHDLLWTVL